MLTQLLYISCHKGNIIENLDDFMARSRDRNQEKNLSSILLSTEEYYLHLIEGNRRDVNELYNRISKDSKHCTCTLLRYIEIKKREFESWHAEHVSIQEFDVGDINLLLPHGKLDFETVTSAQAVTMIRRIHAHLQVKFKK